MKHLHRLFFLFVLLSVIFILGLFMAVSAQVDVTEDHAPVALAQQQPGTVTLEGTLTVLHKDPLPGSDAAYQGLVLLTVSQDEMYVLDMPMGQVWDYLLRQVRVVGRPVSIPASENLGFSTLVNVDFIMPMENPYDPNAFLDPSAGNFKFINVLCQFADTGAPPRLPGYFDALFSMDYPGIGHHWLTVSNGKVSLAGTQTMTNWVRMGITRAQYTNDDDLLNACLAAADPVVDFTQYEGINMMFDHNYVSYALGSPGWPLTLDGQSRNWRVTWNPPLSFTLQYFISHEIGHAINLPHSGGDPTNPRFVYDNLWDVMSGGGENDKLPDPNGVIGFIGPGTNAYYAYRLGWITEAETERVNVGQTKQIVLERIIEPLSDQNKRLIIVPIGGSTNDFYAIEAHFENSYDAAAPATGVVIYRVILNRGQDGLARVVDPDANNNVNDAGATWIVGETFNDAPNNISMTVNSKGTSSFTVTVNNNGAGLPQEQVTWNQPTGIVTDAIGNPRYEWQAVDGAQGYQIYMAAKASILFPLFSGVVPAAQYCNLGVCSVDLTTFTPFAWLPNGNYQLYICPTNNNCALVSGWTGVDPTIEFTIATPAAAAIPLGDFMSGMTGTGWTLNVGTSNVSWFEIYIAPTNDILNITYYNWQTREQLCEDWLGTTCVLPPAITNLFTPGVEYTMYVRSWGPAGFSTGGIEGFGGPYTFTP